MQKIIPTKTQWAKWKLLEKLGYIGFWLAILSLPTILITYGTSIYTYFNSEPKILGVKPVVYINERNDLKHKDWPTPTELGLFFIVHIKNGTKVSTINGLKLKSEKYYLNLEQYNFRFADIHIGKTFSEVEQEWKEKAPYISIEWDAYLHEKNIKKVLYPNDEAYIAFTLLDPILNGQSEGGWELPLEKYLGYSNISKKPEKIRKYPDLQLLFSDFNINKLPPRTIRKDIKLFLTINNKEIPIKEDVFGFVDRVNKYEYSNDSFEKMYIRYFAE